MQRLVGEPYWKLHFDATVKSAIIHVRLHPIQLLVDVFQAECTLYRTLVVITYSSNRLFSLKYYYFIYNNIYLDVLKHTYLLDYRFY